MRRYVLRILALLTALVAGAQAQSYLLWGQAGSGPSYQLGRKIAAAGDANGDGLADLVTGAAAFVGGSPVGQVLLLSGSDGAVLWSVVGTSNPGLGSAVAGVGDLDGDGHDDVAAGVPAGRLAHVLSGANGSVLLTLTGTGGAPFGYAVAGPGDLNGDGVPEILVGGVAGMLGAVTAYSGANGSVLLTVTGTTPGDGFGTAAAGTGDVDGDGTPDFAVGAPRATPPPIFFPKAGEAFVFSGATGLPVHSFQGTAALDLFGTSLAGVGDVTGDGIPDVAVGAPQNDATGPWASGPGYVRVHSGADGSLVHFWSGSLIGDAFGQTVAGGSDVDGDGVPDLVIGVPQFVDNGLSFLGPGYARVFSGANGSMLATSQGSANNEGYGRAVAGLGDADGDGFGDWAVGSPSACACGANWGLVEVRSYAGIPPGSFLFDPGCPGSGGTVPLIQTGGGSPTVGNGQFSLLLSKALGNTTALLLMGASASSWGGIPLPLDLSALGMPGCFLLVSPDIVFARTTSPAGLASVPVPIPPIPSPVLIGAQIHFQWYVVDPGPLPAPGALTKRLRVLVLP